MYLAAVVPPPSTTLGLDSCCPRSAPVRLRPLGRAAPLLLCLSLSLGCDSGKVAEPLSTAKPKPAAATPATPAAGAAGGTGAGGAAATVAKTNAEPKAPLRAPEFGKVSAKPVAAVKPAPGDPLQGKFSMADALQKLPSKGSKLYADLTTSDGKLECELFPDKAPLTVANFVGLARGLRPWKKGDRWVKQPLYDGTVFHRVIKGFMIQGGDPDGNGSGGPGYEIPDEIWEDAHHDKRGLLCMANRGANTNGSQFFVMDGPAPHLDGGYTIFGQCGPDSVIEKLASTPTRGDRAVDPPKISKVVIRRGG
jgi:peptidyl-prolyl cis-trans isomerase A (cyclophilin A)